MRSIRRLLALLLIICVAAGLAQAGKDAEEVRGTVYLDTNKNGTQDASENGVAGVCVSNGIQVTRTGDDGSYSLPARNRMVLFVVKPAGYALPLDEDNVPQFYYVHCPKGSPKSIKKYRGLDPTGDLPDAVNFPLLKSEKKNNFRVAVLGDTQVRNNKEIGYMRDTMVEDLSEVGTDFAVTLGDNMFNKLSLYPRYLSVMGQLDMPVFYVPGNHDMNFDSPNRRYSMDTYKRFLGPDYYSFNVGKVHFIALNDIAYNGDKYHGELGETQLRWLENDLSFVPKDHVVFLYMHIPIFSWFDGDGRHSVADRQKLYDILDGRKALAIGGHVHNVEHFRPGQEAKDAGTAPFPVVLAGAVCGSWWSGRPGVTGVPLSYQREGAPKGYMVYEFDGTDYTGRYRVPHRPADYQMNISLNRPEGEWAKPVRKVLSPEEVDETELVVNFFPGDEGSQVWCRIDGGEKRRMNRSTDTTDPFANRVVPDKYYPIYSSHLWALPVPEDLGVGVHSVEVTATDMYGETYEDSMVFEIQPVEAVKD